jgi:hypothetical protein
LVLEEALMLMEALLALMAYPPTQEQEVVQDQQVQAVAVPQDTDSVVAADLLGAAAAAAVQDKQEAMLIQTQVVRLQVAAAQE